MLLFAGCGSSEDSEESGPGGFAPGTTCGIRLELSGAIEEALDAESAVACATQLSGSAGVDATFLPIGGAETLSGVELSVDAVEKGKTGKGFPAELSITHADKRRWATNACSVDVLAHAFSQSDSFADHYRIVGTTTCSEPAAAVSGSDPSVVVKSLAFVATVPWTKAN